MRRQAAAADATASSTGSGRPLAQVGGAGLAWRSWGERSRRAATASSPCEPFAASASSCCTAAAAVRAAAAPSVQYRVGAPRSRTQENGRAGEDGGGGGVGWMGEPIGG